MKRTLVYGTATALVALSLGGCTQGETAEQGAQVPIDQSTSDDGPVMIVYGPQPWMDDGDEDGYAVPRLNDPDDDGRAVVLYGAPPPSPED